MQSDPSRITFTHRRFTRISESPTFPSVTAEQTLKTIIDTFKRHNLLVAENASIVEDGDITYMVRAVLSNDPTWIVHIRSHTDPENHHLILSLKLEYRQRIPRQLILFFDQEEGRAWIHPRCVRDSAAVMEDIHMSQTSLPPSKACEPFRFGTFLAFVDRIAIQTARGHKKSRRHLTRASPRRLRSRDSL